MDEALTDQRHLQQVAEGLPLLADLHRGDVLLVEPVGAARVRVIAQARPHSVPPIHARALLGEEGALAGMPAVARVLTGNAAAQGARHLPGHRSRIVQRAFPVRAGARLLGALIIEKSLVEHERHAARRPAFRRALSDLRDMVLRGEVAGWAGLPPFQEADGIVLVNQQGIITYLSGVGTHLYRLLGYSEELIGKPVAQQDTADAELTTRALRERCAFTDERVEEERILLRKVIPLVGPRFRPTERLVGGWNLLLPHGLGDATRRTVLITLHDETAARHKAQEQAVRHAMVQEIHHRVKNNLQTVASLLRIQARRAEHEETRQMLAESMNRILSIAIVHEFLSQYEQAINLLDVARRIARQVQEGILGPHQSITVRVEGDPVFLHAHQTTMVALVLNELLLNALEHAFGDATSGEIVIVCTDEGTDARVVVRDNGAGLPSDFDLRTTSSLGLSIVQTIVEQDLRGHLALTSKGVGAAATVTFAKAAAETFA